MPPKRDSDSTLHYHKSSALGRRGTGEVSLAAATANPAYYEGYQPEEQLFLGAEGIQIGTAIGHAFHLRGLPTQGVKWLSASCRLYADHVREAVLLFAEEYSKPSIAAVYGMATLTLTTGIPQQFGGHPTTTTTWREFLKLERANGVTITDISEFDTFEFLDLTCNPLPYDGHSTLIVVDCR